MEIIPGLDTNLLDASVVVQAALSGGHKTRCIINQLIAERGSPRGLPGRQLPRVYGINTAVVAVAVV